MAKLKLRKKTLIKIVNILLLLFVGAMGINLIYYIFVGSKSLMNSDSSFIVDISLEQIRTKSFFPSGWIHTNDFWFYSLIPIITPLIKMGVSLFTARQISVFIQSLFIFAILYDLFIKQFKQKEGFKILLIILLSGVSGQFIFEVFGDATYGSIITYMLVCFLLFIKYEKTEKKRYMIIFSILLAIITSCSLRFPIFIGAPILCCIIYFIYDKGLNKKYIFAVALLIISIGAGYLGNCYMMDFNFINQNTAIDLVNNPNDIGSGINDIVYNYLFLCGSTGRNILSLTFSRLVQIKANDASVIIIFIKYIFAFVTLIIPFLLLKKFNNLEKVERLLLIFSVSLMIIIGFFLLVGRMSYWYRYITPVLFFLILLYPMIYKYFFSDKSKNKIAFFIFIIGCSLASLYLSISTYYDLENKKMYVSPHQEKVDFLLEKNLEYGYAIGPVEHNIYNLLSNGKLRITRLHDQKTISFWLNSKDWFEPEYYEDNIFVIYGKDQEPLEYADEAIDKLEFQNDYIYIFENNAVITDKITNKDVFQR